MTYIVLESLFQEATDHVGCVWTARKHLLNDAASALHMGEKYATVWAAVAGLAPAAFGFQWSADQKLRQVPLLIIVGDQDRLVTIGRSAQELEFPGRVHVLTRTGSRRDNRRRHAGCIQVL